MVLVSVYVLFGFATALQSVFGFAWGLTHSFCKFPCLFCFAVFLHSSCSVVVSYFMFIPVFVILLFSVTVFNLGLGGMKFLWKDLDTCNKRVR